MSNGFDYLSGEIGEKTVYVPVPAARYKAVVARGEMVDPVALGWKPGEELDEDAKEDYERPFPRLRWQIESTESDEPTEYAGRLVDQRLDLRSGTNPKTGRSFAEARADVIRAKNGLMANDEVAGFKLIDVNVAGLDREEAIRVANDALKVYEGTRATIRVIHITSKKTGEVRESVGKIILPKR